MWKGGEGCGRGVRGVEGGGEGCGRGLREGVFVVE